MKTVGILGCTGSIGQSTLKVISSDEQLRVGFLANYSDLAGLKRLIAIYNPETALCIAKNYLYKEGKEYELPDGFLEKTESYADCDIVINGIVGLAGLAPSLAVLRAGKILATANKESFVCAGRIINTVKNQFNGVIYPLDSEHSAVWQLLQGKQAEKIILTASGGAFRDFSKEQLRNATAESALAHPNWKMGKKVTIDCATLMNKGMEIIEAKHLFGLPVEVIGHRESIIHAMIRFSDGSINANLSHPDMALPISYAIHYPDSAPSVVTPLNFAALCSLNFFELDEEKFPCLKLAKQAAISGDISGLVLNAADEVLVNKYINGEINFYDISFGIEKAMDKYATNGDFDDLESVFRMDKAVKEYTLSIDFGGRV